MSLTKADVLATKAARGRIVRTLYQQGNYCNLPILRAAVSGPQGSTDYITETELERLLAYLVQDGYVEDKWEEDTLEWNRQVRFVRLTARGYDLYEGTCRDDGILIER